jgi:hypothetical protein
MLIIIPLIPIGIEVAKSFFRILFGEAEERRRTYFPFILK